MRNCLLYLLLSLFLSACVRFPFPSVALSSAETLNIVKQEKRPIWVVSDTLHCDLVVETEWLLKHGCHLPEGVKSRRYLCFGWGDRVAYTKRWGWRDIPQAILWESESIVQVVAFNTGVSPTFPAHTVSKLEVDEKRGRSLANFLNHSFLYHEGTDTPVTLREAKWGFGYFIASPYSYYAPRMCNQWVSTALREAGVTTARPSPLNCPKLMKGQLERFGAEIRPPLEQD